MDFIVYSLRFDVVEIDLWAACHAFSPHLYAYRVLCSELVQLPHCFPFWEKSSKYYSIKHARLMHL